MAEEFKSLQDYINAGTPNTPQVYKNEPVGSLGAPAMSKGGSLQDQASSFFQDSSTRLGNRGTQFFNPQLTDAFTSQNDFTERGFNPAAYGNNLSRRVAVEDWGSTIDKTFDDFKHKFGGSFMGGLYATGRFLRWAGTLGHYDLGQDNIDMYESYLEDQKNERQNQLFLSPEEKHKFFGKQLFKDVVGNSGFAFGMIAEFALESALTLGVGTLASAALKGTSMASAGSKLFKAADFTMDAMQGKNKLDLAKTWKTFSRQGSNAAARSTQETTKSISQLLRSGNNPDKIRSSAVSFFEKIPVAGDILKTAKDVRAISQAGGTSYQMAKPVLRGTQRMISEISMATGEATIEAASKYGELYDKYMLDLGKKGDFTSEDVRRAQNIAAEGAGALYNANIGVLLTMNRIQFGSMFSKMAPTGSYARKAMSETLSEGIEVLGKKGSRRAVATVTGPMSGIRNTYRIGKQLGKKQAGKYAARQMAKGLLRFEGSEGVQELIQEGSAHAVSEFFDAEYFNHEMTFGQAVQKGLDSQKGIEGLRTFLIGAITGYMTRPVTQTGSYAAENARRFADAYKSTDSNLSRTERLKQAKEAFVKANPVIAREEAAGSLDAFLQNKNFAIAEHFRKIGKSLDAMGEKDEAIRENDQFRFSNAQADEMVSVVQTAIRTNTLDALVDEIAAIGDNMSVEEFSETFGMDTRFQGKELNPKEFAEGLAEQVKGYGETYQNLYDKYAGKIMPELFGENTQERKDAEFAQSALLHSIDVLAGQAIKAEDAVKRAEAIRSRLSADPKLAQSSDYAFRVISDLATIESEIGAVAERLEALETLDKDADITLDKTQKKQLKDLRDEMQALGEIKSMYRHEDFSDDADMEGRAPQAMFTGGLELAQIADLGPKELNEKLKSPKVRKLFQKLMDIKDRQAGGKGVTQEVIDSNIDDLVDLARLRSRAADFVRASDILMNPKNFTTLYTNFYNSLLKYEVAASLHNALHPNSEIMILLQAKAFDRAVAASTEGVQLDLFTQEPTGDGSVQINQERVRDLFKEELDAYQAAIQENPHYQVLEKILVDPDGNLNFRELITNSRKELGEAVRKYANALAGVKEEETSETIQEESPEVEQTTKSPAAQNKNLTIDAVLGAIPKNESDLVGPKLLYKNEYVEIAIQPTAEGTISITVSFKDSESGTGYRLNNGLTSNGDFYKAQEYFKDVVFPKVLSRVEKLKKAESQETEKKQETTEEELTEEEEAYLQKTLTPKPVEGAENLLPSSMRNTRKPSSALQILEGDDFSADTVIAQIAEKYELSDAEKIAFKVHYESEGLKDQLVAGEDFDMDRVIEDIRQAAKNTVASNPALEELLNQASGMAPKPTVDPLDIIFGEEKNKPDPLDILEGKVPEAAQPAKEEPINIIGKDQKYQVHLYKDRAELFSEGKQVFVGQRRKQVADMADLFNELDGMIEAIKEKIDVTDPELIRSFIQEFKDWNLERVNQEQAAQGIAEFIKSKRGKEVLKSIKEQVKNVDLGEAVSTDPLPENTEEVNSPELPEEGEGSIDTKESNPEKFNTMVGVFTTSESKLVELREKSGILSSDEILQRTQDLLDNC